VEPAAAARAEAAWLERRADAVAELTDVPLALASRRHAPWIVGELGCWRQRAGIRDELPFQVPDPWASELAGDLRRAATLWTELDAPYEAALALAGSESVDDLLRALDGLRALQAEPAAAIVTRRLREHGFRGPLPGPRASTLSNPAQLTGRELEVLVLIGQNLSERRDRGPPRPLQANGRASRLGDPAQALRADPWRGGERGRPPGTGNVGICGAQSG
jgi:hypothetical protein